MMVGDIMNKTISFGFTTNTANQIGYLNFSSSSSRFSGFFSYTQAIQDKLFTLPERSKPNAATLAAIDESKHLSKLITHKDIDGLMHDLES
jgi:hypothetical protein